ncbi:serine hydrolase domain-containing protein [Egicoccus sp. AB-alg2]|uniref:serine hydrolase domain-containing protein n=1 Tax=Egicoccus sp. AB-alg2 TaxID=3242693 RepID=UPI00359E48A4
MTALADRLGHLVADAAFSGVVRIDRDGDPEVVVARGMAQRGEGIPNRADTRFAIASGTKGLTALTVMSLVADGAVGLDTPARALLGADLPSIDDAVTVGDLLAHRSGIGDYLDEESLGDIDEYVLSVPVHTLATTDGYLPLLEGHPQKFPPGERFTYCNSGYVVLALLAERITGRPFHDLVVERVCAPAGMHDTAFERTDALPGGVALGYLDAEGPRTNLLHLPVRGSGDGGIHTTVDDVHALWRALFEGRIVPAALVEAMVHPHSDVPAENLRYGLGFWLEPDGDGVALEGYDAGVSFRSIHRPAEARTLTVVANSSEGAWPVAKWLANEA